MKRLVKPLLIVSLGLAAVAGLAVWYFAFLPLYGHQGPLPALTAQERELAGRLKSHVVAIASVPHNTDHPEALEAAAVHIERQLAGLGYPIERQVFEAAGQQVRNIHVGVGRRGEWPASRRTSFVVGAHYDSWSIAPGANDNGTGTAALLELARLLKDFQPRQTYLRLVFFVNEERPHFGTETMGSLQFARWLTARETVTGMISVETIGAYDDRPGSQRFPVPMNLVYRDTGNFITFVGLTRGRDLVHRALGSFRRHTAFPSIGGVSHSIIPGVAWSDHASFDRFGVPALMVTDTALFRYPHYHKATDTPDKIDYERLARVTTGLERTIREIVD